MQGSDQQAYDRGTTIFSPDGRLYQVEYAREAVKQGAPVVGVRGAESVVLASHSPRRSPLVEPGSVEKLFAVDGHVAIGSAGHAADTRRLVDLARRRAQDERLRYDEPVTVDALATHLADHLQEYTQTGGARPYGTALMVAGYDDAPRLVEIDPSGATRQWRADAVGAGASDALDQFEEEYDSGLTEGEALSLALRGLETTVDEFGIDEVDAGVVTEAGYETAAQERLQTVFENE
jgi:proteasome alpha subunit